jgi:predicted nucleic acid-binding protein
VANFSAVYDACVLYPAPLRDLLLQLALTDVFRAHWTADIHKEWMRNVTAHRPDIAPGQLERTRELMDAHVRDCLVEGYESLNLPDEGDRHVLAAAIVSGADVIVTYNLKDFPDEKLNTYGIEAQHPDEFLMHLIDLAPPLVCAAVATIRSRLRNPPKTATEYIDTLEQQQLPQTASALREFEDQL